MDKKELKSAKEKLQTSITNAETSLTLAISQGNKRAELSARRVLERLQKDLQALKGPK